MWFVMWGCLVQFGVAVLGLGPTWWFWGPTPGLRELGLVVYVACARDVGFWFYLFVLFGVIVCLGCGLFGFVYDVLSGGFVSGCCPLPMF